jgi:hypothetical protein
MTQILTNRCRLNYVRLKEKESYGEGLPTYSLMLMIPKTDLVGIDKIKSAIDKTIAETDLKINKSSKKFWMPLIDGIEKDSEIFHDYYYIKAKSQYEIPIVDKDRNILQKDDPSIYSGCYGRANIAFKVYNKKGEGVSCFLQSLQILEDGPLLEANTFDPNKAFADNSEPNYKNLL